MSMHFCDDRGVPCATFLIHDDNYVKELILFLRAARSYNTFVDSA